MKAMPSNLPSRFARQLRAALSPLWRDQRSGTAAAVVAAGVYGVVAVATLVALGIGSGRSGSSARMAPSTDQRWSPQPLHASLGSRPRKERRELWVCLDMNKKRNLRRPSPLARNSDTFPIRLTVQGVCILGHRDAEEGEDFLRVAASRCICG